jgi:hypothetical protein
VGYSTEFYGEFQVSPPLTPEQVAYLQAFSTTRRMKRYEDKAAALPDPIREAVLLPIGIEGAYFVGGEGSYGQDNDESVADYNTAPGSSHVEPGPMETFSQRYLEHVERERKAIAGGAQPGLWCQWKPTDDGTLIVWDGGEKFYEYIPWIQYLIDNFLTRWGRVLHGDVEWRGEEYDDRGRIVIIESKVFIQHPKDVWTRPKAYSTGNGA